MNQNRPPNEPGTDDRNPDDRESPSFARNPGDEAYENPYYRGRRAQGEPDLDADAPVLRTSDVQRLNRKALLFLAGILAFLMVMVFWLLSGRDEPEEAANQPQQRVQVPDLPPPAEPAVPPIEVAQEPATVLPPLPEEDYAAADTGRGAPAGPPQPSLVDRRIAGLEGSSTGGSSAAGQATATEATSAQYIGKPDALLVRGTYLRCVLETRIVTDIPGYTSCILTEPVYSINGRSLLLPKGSKILGSYDDEPETNRVAVVWDRVITPTGIDVSMKSPGVDGLGGSGHPGDKDSHWGSKIASALLISLISDAFSWAAAEHGPKQSATIVGPGGFTVVDQPFESATARSMERLANQALMESANRGPTVTINQGSVVNVYVAQDVDFSGVQALR